MNDAAACAFVVHGATLEVACHAGGREFELLGGRISTVGKCGFESRRSRSPNLPQTCSFTRAAGRQNDGSLALQRLPAPHA